MKTESKIETIITPDSTLAEIAEVFQGLFGFLQKLSGKFSEFESEFARERVASVVTLRQAAVIGGLNLSEVLSFLRTKTGQESMLSESVIQDGNSETPSWIIKENIKIVYDAGPDLQAGIHPVAKVTSEMESLQPGDIYQLITSFIPSPLIDMMKNKGYEVFVEKRADSEVCTFIRK